MTETPPAPTLADLRREIDRIDETMHALLIERSQIVENLIRVKKTLEVGSAFRPAREADMMRRIVGRHTGILPLDTVESIWRVIISTFTYVQANYAVHADISVSEPLMRDTSRFHFGFTVPLVPHIGASAAVEALARARGDLALVPVAPAPGAVPWWGSIEPPDAPKIIARLPFVERPDHPAALPVFVVARVAGDAAVTEVEVWSLRVSGWSAAAARAIIAPGEVVSVPDGAFDGAALIVSVPSDVGIEPVRRRLVTAGVSIRAEALIGSHASRYKVSPRP